MDDMDVPENEEGRDHRHPGVSSGGKSSSQSSDHPLIEDRVHHHHGIRTDLSPSSQGNILCHPSPSPSCLNSLVQGPGRMSPQ